MPTFVPRTSEDLDLIAEEGWSESSTLEFKSSRVLDIGNRDKFADDLSKDVSAFANAVGGVIIVGIEEAEHRAQRVAGWGNSKIDALWFENVFLRKISPIVAGIELIAISHHTGTVVVISIPSSLAAPHSGPDKRYYARRQLRNDVLERHEIDLLRLRTENKDDLVFGGIIVSGHLVLATVENRRQTPIYDVQITVPHHVKQRIKHPKKVLNEGLVAVGARSDVQSLLDSVYTFLTEYKLEDPFEYEFTYSLEPKGAKIHQHGIVSLGDLADSMLTKTDVERIEDAIGKGFESLVKELSRRLHSLEESFERISGPTGLSISASTIARAARAFGASSQDTDYRWRGEWLSPQGFSELLNVQLEEGFQLYHLFDPCRYPSVSKAPLVSLPFISSELEQRIRALVLLPDWM